MTQPNLAVEQHYAELERRWTINDSTNEYSRLVVPYGNSDEPFHRWFHLKEAFSYDLVRRLVKDLNLNDQQRLRVLDCFAGSGTTLVSSIQLEGDFPAGVEVVGIESNPFLYRLAATKAYAAIRPTGLQNEVKGLLKKVRNQVEGWKRPTPNAPEQSTWQNDKFFSPVMRDELMRIRESISSLDDSLARDILSLCAAAAVEPASKLRRDGRALRYEPKKVPRKPLDEFTRRVNLASEDLAGMERINCESTVINGDGRRLHDLVAEEKTFDLIVFSPPYPNNIDYTEVYKAEAWYLGYYENEAAFKKQRLSTVRSHPSVRYAEEYLFRKRKDAPEVEALLQPLMCAIPEDRYMTGRKQLVQGYADDMLCVLESARKRIEPHGRLVFVVGNSVHGGTDEAFIIAADILMARLAELAGWRVQEIRVARNLSRRQVSSPYLRESVVILHPGTAPTRENG